MSDFELIVCIINAGHSQDVMDAAKKAGARGGTILRARGTANAQLEKQLGIAIQPEKELALIIVKKEIKDSVLRAVYTDCGLESSGQGIAFSLPVDGVAGSRSEGGRESPPSYLTEAQEKSIMALPENGKA